MKPPVFGIHVGNSTASLAIYREDGKIDIIANEIGERVTPAIVTIRNHEKLVGSVAKSLLIQQWNCTVTDNKRLMNRSLSDTEKEKACKKCRVSTEYVNGELCYAVPLEEKSEKYTPAEIATLIYKKLYDIAKSAIHAGRGDVVSCVILVPTYFDTESIVYTKGAVEDAGWTILQIIKETVAPVLAHSLLEKGFNEKRRNSSKVQSQTKDLADSNETLVLVYRLGGVSCEAAVVKVFSGFAQILGTSYKDNIGASQLIGPLTDYLAVEFFRKYKLDPSESPKSMGKLRQVAEMCMHSLSKLNNASCFVESLYEGVDFNHTVSRARLETYLTPLLSIYSEPIHDVLEKTNLMTDLIHKVILCGGLMKIPKLQCYISGMFANAEVLGGLAPDEVLAYGAAQQAGYLVSHLKLKSSQRMSKEEDAEPMELRLPLIHSIDITDQHIQVRILDDINKEVQFEKGSAIPCHEVVWLEACDCPAGIPRTFHFEVLVDEEKKSCAEITITSEEKSVHQIEVSISREKKLEIKVMSKNLLSNKRHTRIVHLKPMAS